MEKASELLMRLAVTGAIIVGVLISMSAESIQGHRDYACTIAKAKIIPVFGKDCWNDKTYDSKGA